MTDTPDTGQVHGADPGITEPAATRLGATAPKPAIPPAATAGTAIPPAATAGTATDPAAAASESLTLDGSAAGDPEPRQGVLAPRDLALIALFAAFIAVLGLPGAIPVFGSAVPITAQTLAVMLAPSILGARRGALAIVTFLVLVAAGLPLLSGGRGGLGVFAGPSAGYLIGWIFGAWVIGVLTDRILPKYRFWPGLLFNIIGGIAVIYAFGIPVSAWRTGSWELATILSAAQYLPGDLLKAVIAAAIAAGVHRAYPVPRAARSQRPDAPA